MVEGRKRPSAYISDHETKIDLLNYESIATTIVALLCDNPEQPVTIGVHGDWGAGKSSVLEMIEAGLQKTDGVLCLKFNGWRFQGFEDAKIALIEGIVTGLIENRPSLNQATELVKEAWRCIDWLKIAKKAGGLALTAATGIPITEIVRTAGNAMDAFLAEPTKAFTAENARTVIDAVKGAIKPDTDSKKIPEEIRAFHKAFGKLLESAGIKQLVVLIDDLDRCLPKVAIETLEAIRLFVFTAKTAFVIAADEAMIEYAVRDHFPDYPETSGSQTYARNYLEKLIHVPFRIPTLGESETRIYVTLLLISAEIGPEDLGFSNLINASREKLRRPWEIANLDTATVKQHLGEANASSCQNAIFLSNQIGPTLAKGTAGNPRQIKRFINTLLLRKRIADARGFGNDISTSVLAKVMLAERFLPSLFRRIGSACTASTNGRCKEILLIEETIHRKPAGDGAKGDATLVEKEKKGADEAATASEKAPQIQQPPPEWMESEEIRTWAALEPRLGELDLRPYFFVAKDRKEYLGSLSALGQLGKIVDQLLGHKMIVQRLKPELAKLTEMEAEQVFEAIKEKVQTSETLESEPKGMQGLRGLVASKPMLEGRLLDLLEGLPADKIGSWAVQGWEGTITTTEGHKRLAKLMDNWQATGSSSLKAAIGAVKKVNKGKV